MKNNFKILCTKKIKAKIYEIKILTGTMFESYMLKIIIYMLFCKFFFKWVIRPFFK